MNLKPYPEYKDSGVAWLGDVPKHWEIVSGMAVIFEKQVKNTGMKENTVLSLSYGRIVIKSQDKLHGLVPESFETYQIVEPGDIIIRSTDLQNDWTSLRVGKVKNKGIITSAYLCLKVKGNLNGEFVYWLLHGFDLMKVFYGMGSGLRQNLSWIDFKRMPMVIPTEAEQTTVAQFLYHKTAQIARFIKAKKRMIELLKEQKQVIINDAVAGKIVIKDEGGRLKAEKRPDSSFRPHPSSFLQTVPEGWEVRRLRTIATVKPSGVDKKSHEGELPVQLCNYVDVYKNQEINSSLNFMKATATPEEIKNFTLIHGDIIITKDSETWDDIAVPAIVTENMDVICAYHLALIRTTTQEITNKYLYRAISADPIADHFRVSANGVTRFGLSQGAIKDVPIPIPSIQEQSQIVSYIETKTAAIGKAISRTEREIALMQEYRTRLISDVVTGKIDVRDIKIPDVAGIDDTLDESIDEPEGEEELETTEAEE
ncbi:EcoKI restriction-modification system protein HsdS [Candidatus Brocadiaceae bacterium B188]|nr:restriction endonuclease subunit S [Candidatus Brocadia sapporoensis]QQR65523.1 MAG: restriction endonuclease subunit S [Candidatus Brocadia sp.]RZV57244.1 MAG: restriction endonuclease subunit S [Candidatus Brocadia sp. BROELEC01]TWU50424.1 EcoKI restriction-modification system protein HsdS [Candidatus Brocadiaceae bacterium B188]